MIIHLAGGSLWQKDYSFFIFLQISSK